MSRIVCALEVSDSHLSNYLSLALTLNPMDPYVLVLVVPPLNVMEAAAEA